MYFYFDSCSRSRAWFLLILISQLIYFLLCLLTKEAVRLRMNHSIWAKARISFTFSTQNKVDIQLKKIYILCLWSQNLSRYRVEVLCTQTAENRYFKIRPFLGVCHIANIDMRKLKFTPAINYSMVFIEIVKQDQFMRN